MIGDVYQMIIVAMIFMIIGTVAAFYIYYEEMKKEQKEKEEQMKKDSQILVKQLKDELAARDASANAATAATAINLAKANIPTDWMSDTLTNITGGRLFRITDPVYTYADVSNSGDAICQAFDSKSSVANYSHLRYAYTKGANGVRGDASANWCQYAWGRGGKTSADGLAYKMADSAYTEKYKSECGADSSGIFVLNAYKWNPETKMGIICYTPNATITAPSKSPVQYNGTNITATYEAFTSAMEKDDKKVENKQDNGSFVGNVKKALNNMMTPILPSFAETRESFITYNAQQVPVFSDSAFKSTMDGKYSLF